MNRPVAPLRAITLLLVLFTTFSAACSSGKKNEPPKRSADCGGTLTSSPAFAAQQDAALVTRDTSLYLRDMKSGKENLLITAASGLFITYPAWAPDGSRFVFMVDKPFLGKAGDDWGTDIYLADAAGGCPKLLLKHQQSGEDFESPTWTPDGKTIAYSYFYTQYDAQGQYKGQTYEARRLDLASDAAAPFLPNANGTNLCRDGSRLTYLNFDQTDFNSYGIWVSNPDGSNGKDIVDSSTNIQAFYAPTFSPDCKQIVFDAVGGGLQNLPVTPTHKPIARLLNGFESLAESLNPFSPGVAEAHGPPWDLWIVNADGSGLTRLTHLNEDLPYPQWSKDGKTIALFGSYAFYELAPDGSNVKKVGDGTVHGQISWLQK